MPLDLEDASTLNPSPETFAKLLLPRGRDLLPLLGERPALSPAPGEGSSGQPSRGYAKLSFEGEGRVRVAANPGTQAQEQQPTTHPLATHLFLVLEGEASSEQPPSDSAKVSMGEGPESNHIPASFACTASNACTDCIAGIDPIANTRHPRPRSTLRPRQQDVIPASSAGTQHPPLSPATPHQPPNTAPKLLSLPA